VDTVGISVVVPAYNEVEASQIQVVYPTSYLACFKKGPEVTCYDGRDN
jgi:hypothetical protein